MDDLDRLKELADKLVVKDDGYKCHCGKVYKHKRDLLRHQNTIHKGKDHICSNCGGKFNRKDNFNRHVKSCRNGSDVWKETDNDLTTNKKRKADHDDDRVTKKQKVLNVGKCNWCGHEKELLDGKKFCESCGLNGRECNWCHRPLPERFYGKRNDVCDSCVTRRDNYVQRGGNATARATAQALEGTVESTRIYPTPGNLWDVLLFFVDNQETISNILIDALREKTGIKWYLTLHVKLIKYNQNNEAVYADPTFRSFTSILSNVSQSEEEVAGSLRKLHNDYQNFEKDGSGWSIDQILEMEVHTVEYKPLNASSFVPLPHYIANKKAVLNIVNDDNKCFKWSVLAAIHNVPRDSHPNQVSHYIKHESELTFQNISMPMSLSDIPKFESQNQISINVFGLAKHEVYPLFVTKCRYDKHVNLLLISDKEKRHYCLIRSMSRLLGDRTKHNGETFYCNYCLHGYSSTELLENHIIDCKPHGAQKVTFPKNEEDRWIHFTAINKQLRVPFVIYADFECFTKPVNEHRCATTRYQKHIPSGFSYVVKCSNDQMSKPAKVYRGSDVVETFLRQLLEEEKEISDILDQVVPMQLSVHEEKQFQDALQCHICGNKLGDDRVRDHDHLTGAYRGAAHAECNLQLQFRKAKRSNSNFSKYFIPVVFHNLKGYDLHLLMSSVGQFKDRKLTCIPNNMEKYISFSLDNLRFIDSYQFMKESLSTLVENLAKSGKENFSTLRSHYTDEKQFQLLIRKGVYPYDHVTDEQRFLETQLPPPDAFYNRLTDSHISDEDHDHAQHVWRAFQIKTMGDYHDLYLKSDVLLLADVFENFRDTCMKSYHLDPAHYYTAPGLSWEAMLKKTGANLELLDDIDMVNMIQKGIRGGVSMISQKYAKANNPLVPDYDVTKPNSWITYLDMNNLYGTAMEDYLPEKDFEWLSESEMNNLDITRMTDDSDTGYFLEVDLEYPANLHDLHNSYPLAPESKSVTDDMLSELSKHLKTKLNIKGKPSTKLIPNLSNKEKYVLHYRNLKLYLAYGMKLTKVHRVIKFSQSAWLKPYIEFNTNMRKLATNEFQKDFFKLMNNSVFGKFMENVFNRINVELVTTSKRMRKISAKPNFQSFKIFNQDLVAANMKRTNLIFNKPTYVGFSILDISKIYMYKFHYDYMIEKYGQNAHLLYTDTDSLTYLVETDDLYQDMLGHLDLFDTSNYPKDHMLYSAKNTKSLGKMKDETASRPIHEFCGLRSKMYSMKFEGREKDIQEKKTAKGVSRTVINKQLKHDSYRDCLFEQNALSHDMNFIRSHLHQLYSVTVNKTTLSPYDDKRYVLADGIHTLSHGHYKI